MYEYRAQVIRVVDGDTVWLDFDQGFDTHIRLSCRLAGINAPEMGTPEGKIAKQHLEDLIQFFDNPQLQVGTDFPGSWAPIMVKTLKDRREKYGRYLVYLFREIDGNLVNLNDRMVEDGHAGYYDVRLVDEDAGDDDTSTLASWPPKGE